MSQKHLDLQKMQIRLDFILRITFLSPKNKKLLLLGNGILIKSSTRNQKKSVIFILLKGTKTSHES